jgi:Bifunctional DNA primase/polymerase, N-terminal
LAARGLRVFPIVARTKNPAIKDNLKLAAIDETIIRAWWRNLDFNIGVATGQGSGVWVLDLDNHEHESWLREREAAHGPLPPTVESITARGRHLFFKWPGGAVVRNSQDDDSGPHVRGEGGYVLAPPSIHPSGRKYCWSVDSADAFADAPEWLIAHVTKGRGVDGEAIAAPPEAWRTFVDEDHDGSHRGWAIAKLAGLLLRKYLDPFVALGICEIFNQARCVEPLDGAEVSAIVNRVARLEARRRERSGEEKGDAP